MIQPISDVRKFHSFLSADRARFGKMCRVCWYLASDDVEVPVEILENINEVKSETPLKLVCRVSGPRHFYFFDITPYITKLQRKIRRSLH